MIMNTHIILYNVLDKVDMLERGSHLDGAAVRAFSDEAELRAPTLVPDQRVRQRLHIHIKKNT